MLTFHTIERRHTCLWIQPHFDVHKHVNACALVSVCGCVHASVHVCTCVYVCMCVCACVYVCMCACVHKLIVCMTWLPSRFFLSRNAAWEKISLFNVARFLMTIQASEQSQTSTEKAHCTEVGLHCYVIVSHRYVWVWGWKGSLYWGRCTLLCYSQSPVCLGVRVKRLIVLRWVYTAML